MDAAATFRSAGRAEFPESGRVRRIKRRDIDWNAIERDYRASPLSLRELALKHGCSHSTIANFASRHGWTRSQAEASGRPTASRAADRPPSAVGDSCHRVAGLERQQVV